VAVLKNSFTKTPVKILFFSHDGKLGDAVVNTAFVDGARQLDPTVELQALVSGTTAGFWALDRRVSKTWMYENPPLGEALRTSMALRRERFDYIVTWKERFRSEKTKLMLWLAKPTRGILYEEGRVPGTVSHAVRKCQESLRLIFGERATAITPRYRLGLDLGHQPDAFAGQLPARGEVILFNMFSAEKPKTINTDDGARVLAGLAALAPQATLCTSCVNATEGAAREAVTKAGVRCELINTDKDLQRLILLCARADLIVSTDTSLIHIASALDKPVLGIYLNDPVKAQEWAPLTGRAEAVVSPRKDSVNGFSVDEVLEKARRLRAIVATAPAA
jgi:ADP-heptose:LPS heptosyltransferase